jgi:hypothetical protein
MREEARVVGVEYRVGHPRGQNRIGISSPTPGEYGRNASYIPGKCLIAVSTAGAPSAPLRER